MIINKIGENIRLIRTLKGYSQEGLANKLGKSQNWIQKIEKGEIDVSIKNLEEISKELDIDIEQLITFESKQIFNKCNQSGTFNNCVINSEQLFTTLIEIIKKIETKL